MSQDERRRRARRRRRSRRERRARRSSRRRSSALAALSSSALALPGLAGSAAADSPIEKYSADYNYTFYTEDDLKKSQVSDNSVTRRYEIETHQFRVAAPITARTDVSVDVTYESMSGATPWYILPSAQGKPIQVMSGATIQEERTDVAATGSYYFDDAKVSLGGGYSFENDYSAINGNLGGEMSFFDKNTTVSGSLGFSLDEVEPTDADQFITRPRHESKRSYALSAGVSQILSRTTAFQTSLTYQHARGFLSDPYKEASVGANLVADSRPHDRNQIALLARLRQHVPAMDASLHLDYRFYWDDWEVTSHTAELAWYQSFWRTFRFIPSFRYYTQSRAFFYAPFYEGPRSDGLASSDYRLSPYGAISWRLRLEKHFANWFGRLDWLAALSWERYLSGTEYAAQGVDVENPGLVGFNLVTVTFTGRF